ncbi:MAG: DUF6268 family outer membrane beta-barrel protein [Chitinophagaceae bacterium]|nr:DUF6268 family outer membrane beta-barrel protein [Chitinophagaceae bacterium]
MKTAGIVFTLLICFSGLFAQEDSTDTEDYSQYTDEVAVKRFATQKVLNLSATKLISVGYEMQTTHFMDVAIGVNTYSQFYKVRQASGPRVLVNFPIVSNDKVIFNLGGQYWGTFYTMEAESPTTSLNPPADFLDKYMLHSMGIISSVFKPLNEKNFLILQLGADFNGAFPGNGNTVNGEAITISGTAIYGWKPNDRKMWGIGVARTYRMGRPIVVPVLLWNQTFNAKWGTEIALPAKGFLRRNISPSSMLLAGYELEGNQYMLPGAGGNATATSNLWLQRGEIKPRIQWEKQLKNFIWLSTQAGVRINGRFNFTDSYNGKESDEVFRTVLGSPFYFNIGINLVSP